MLRPVNFFFTMTNFDFDAVVSRLKLVLDVAREQDVCARLGFTTSAWSMRKKRGSLPRKEIDALIAAEELNPEFIYNGTGDVHVPVEGESWDTQYVKRAALCGFNDGWLRSRGHSDALIAEVLAPKPGGKPYKVLVALRDVRQVLGADLNWLLAAESTPQRAAPAGATLTPVEQRLLDAYRKASTLDKAVIERSAGI